MRAQKIIGRGIWLTVALAGAALPAGAVADTVWLQSGKGTPLALKNVVVRGVSASGLDLTYVTASGNPTQHALDHIPQIQLDDEPTFSAAEAAFVAKDWATAADDYRKTIASTSKDWVKDRCSMRLVDAADHSGNFNDALAGFIMLLKGKPALASEHKPTIPKNHPELLDPAIAQIKQALLDATLSTDQKTVLLNYLLSLYGAKGDTASAQLVIQQLGKIAPADMTSPANRRIAADSKLAQARQEFSQREYAQAAQTLVGGSALFTDPNQQADAMYLLAQSKSAAARPSDPDQLKDAALAFMRVVALFKDTDGRPHVGESLYDTAQIEEKLKNPKEALALYNQVVEAFKGTPLATAAQEAASRVSAAAAADTTKN